MVIRLTPKNRLWIANETRGNIVATDCPFELTRVINTYEDARWLTVGEGENGSEIGISGTKSEKQKTATAFSCESINKVNTKKTFPIQKSSWALFGEEKITMQLQENNIQITLDTNLTGNEQYPWPKNENITALPINPENGLEIPQIWQGLQDIFFMKEAKIFFSWKSEHATEYAIVIEGPVSEDVGINFFYDVSAGEVKKTTTERADGKKYETESRSKIFIEEERDGIKKVRDEAGNTIGIIFSQNQYTVLSTEESEWITTKPYWKAYTQSQTQTQSHSASTLDTFGEKIFIKENVLTIFNE